MSGRYIDIDAKELQDFVDKLGKAADSDFKKMLQDYMLYAIADKFLDIVTEEVINTNTTQDRNLLKSFSRGDPNNIYEIKDSGISIEVGSNVKYASYVNDGHNQQPGRFIPGYWDGNRFVHVPGSDTGMVLKAKYVEGKHYFDHALDKIEDIIPGFVGEQCEKWLEQYFAEFL